ncbi:hypothetical protein GDO86_016434, partial [Hymenochirus boettgeri]
FFEVYSPTQSVMPKIGEDVILNCYLVPSMNAEDMDVRWIRSEDGSLVHLYRLRNDELWDINTDFHGRTEFMKHNIADGNVSLKIHNITASDEGKYICHFQSKVFYSEATVDILPAGIGSHPILKVEVISKDKMNLSFMSSGWYPKPEVLCLDGKKKSVHFLGGVYQHANHHYNADISLVLEKGSQSIYSCIFKNTRAMQEVGATIEVSVNITLDPETAHSELLIVKNTLTRAKEKLNVLDNPNRFDTRLYVLGTEGFETGNIYWEVDVSNAEHWTLGVASEGINRKGKIELSPKKGFWVIELLEDKYKAYTDPATTLNLSKKPRRIGIFLYLRQMRKIIFYDAGNSQKIFSFNINSIQKPPFYPFFSVWTKNETIHLCSPP